MPTTRKTKPRAIGYIRVSTTEQATEGVSLEAQADRLRAYSELRGLDLVEVVVDAGVSASKPLADREGGARVLAALRRRKEPVQHVVTVKLDRLFRATVDCLVTVEEWTKAGVALHLLDLGGQTIDTSNSTGQLFLTMLAGFAELERKQIGERTAAALAHRRAQGKRVSRWTPYGFRLAANGIDLESHPKERRVVELIRSLQGDGHSVRAIAAALNERGVPARGARWHHTTIHRLLKREPIACAT